MNTMLKLSFTFIAVASFAASALADSKRPWAHTSDDFSAQQAHVQTYAAVTYAAQPQVESRRAFSFEPAPTFKAGDMAVVAKAMSQLKVGNRLLANVPQGTRFTVLAVQGNWIGASIEQNGRQVSGWVANADLTNGPITAPSQGR